MRASVLRRIAVPLTHLWSAAGAIGHYDFCPWANVYVYWMRQPIGWFVVGALASVLVGLFVAPQGWLVFGVLAAVMVLGVVWPWVSLRGVTVALAFDRGRCRESESVQVRLAIRNRWPCPAWGLVVERGFFESACVEDGSPAVTALARVPGWSQSEYAFTFRPERRGVYPQVVPMLATGFPFGIWSCARPVPVAGELTVWPQTVPLTSVPAVGGDRLTAGGSHVDCAGDDGDILAARFYREGDSLRQVHWAQTARRDVLVVCERQTTARRRVVVALDGAAFAGKTHQDGLRLDWAVRVFASLCRELHAHHCDLACWLGGESLMLQPGAAGLRRLLDRLARYEPDASCATRLDSDALGSGSLVIMITRRVPQVAGYPRGRAAASPRWVLVDGLTEGVPATSGDAVVAAVRPWIALDATEDVAGQLQYQWGRLCHDGRIN
jgi:uncharacterized protein (DUF58 family)